MEVKVIKCAVHDLQTIMILIKVITKG